jgi:anti-sigma regulatory factor (Ser/Thr protein kinase)
VTGPSGRVVVDVHLPPRLDAVRAARSALDALAARLPLEARADLALLTTELVTNSVLHGELPPQARISLRVREGGGRLRVEVRDEGPGFTPPSHPPAADAVSGRGLMLVDRIARAWGIERSCGTCVWFELAG